MSSALNKNFPLRTPQPQFQKDSVGSITSKYHPTMLNSTMSLQSDTSDVPIQRRFSPDGIINVSSIRHKTSGHINNDKNQGSSQRSICRIYDDTTENAAHFYDEVPNISENKKRYSDYLITSNYPLRNMAKRNAVLPVKTNSQYMLKQQDTVGFNQVSAINSDTDEEGLPVCFCYYN